MLKLKDSIRLKLVHHFENSKGELLSFWTLSIVQYSRK
jgi:hypothetical protein